LAVTLLVTAVASGEEQPSRVGKRVILRTDGVRIGHTDGNGQQVYVGELTDMCYRVLGETDGWLRVRQCGADGWFSNQNAVLLEDAVAYFTDRIRGNSRDALAYAHRGRAWQEQGSFDRALQDYDDAIRTPTEVEEPRFFGPFGLRPLFVQRFASHPPQASWYRSRGVVYDRKGDRDKAVREFAEAIRMNPNDPLTYVERGIVYKASKDYDKAVADYSDAIRLDPRWSTAYFNRANVFKTRKDYNKALGDYDAAIRLDPKDPDAYFNRASTYEATRQFARAADDWGEVIRLDDRDAEARQRLSWLLATCPDKSIRDGRRAVEHAEAAYDLTDGKSARCMATLAAAFAETGRFELAVRWQKRALESRQYADEEGTSARRRLQLFEDARPYREE
jgi:tetratricopeptide (TPR) repeat protein